MSPERLWTAQRYDGGSDSRSPTLRRLGVRRVVAAFLDAADSRAGARHLLDQERRGALGAGLGDGAVPGDEVAVGLRVVGAAEEDLAAARALLGEVAAAAFLRAGDP